MKIWQFAVTGWLGCVGAIAVSIHPTFAQLTPDNTLGKERSLVVPINQNNDRIQGGAARGDINISTNRLTVRDRAGVFSGSIGKGDAGNIIISANVLEILGS